MEGSFFSGVMSMSGSKGGILLIDCEDRTGLVHHVTGVLYRRGLNIVSNHEFVDRDTGRFFMRTEFAGACGREQLEAELRSLLPEGAGVRFTDRGPKGIVVMVTREHHCVGDLLLRHEFHRLNARILAVVSNHDDLRSLTERFHVPFHHVPHENRSREDHEREILSVLEAYNPAYIVLAKYMRILSDGFVSRYPDRIINIHHSFLPAFKGAQPYRQAYERGVKIIGATGHFVNGSLDEGPIIAQSVIPVDHSHGVEDMQQAGRDVEKVVLARALNLVLDDRVFVNGNKTVIFD